MEEYQENLKKYRNIIIGDYNIKISRSIWIALLLYKFKDEMNVGEILWNQSRKVIISIIKKCDKDEMDTIITEYIKLFEVWKENDIMNLMFEISSTYYNIIQIKKSIEDTNNNNTICEWKQHYDILLQNIRDKCIKLGTIQLLDENIELIEQNIIKQKYLIVKEMMDTAYWDNINEMIKNNDYSLVYSNLLEIKSMIIEILPEKHNNYIDEVIDIEYIKSIVENKALTSEFVINLFINVMTILKECDSIDFITKYENELDNIDYTLSYDNMITVILKKIMLHTIDLKNRKAIWKKILNIS